jgi:hypothetical protein
MKILRKAREYFLKAPCFDTSRFYHCIMSLRSGFITKGITHAITAIKCLASPGGTSIEELSGRLSLTRRSVFRLLRVLEHDFHIPVVVSREIFGGTAAYKLPSDFIDKFSHITIPSMALTFDETILFYLLVNSDIGTEAHNNVSVLRDTIKSLFTNTTSE